MTNLGKHRRVPVAAILLFAAVLSAAAVRIAVAEDASGAGSGAVQQIPQNPAPPAAGSFPPQPAPVEKRGLLNDFGDWWDQSIADFNAKMKAAGQKLQDFSSKQNNATKEAAAATQQATKDAAAAVVNLPSTRVFELHARCTAAANGAPDCAAAATNACREKGFTGGQPMDVRTSQECPPAVIASGRTPAPGECRDETVVLRAVCQ
jgi:hypothetical protein